LKSFSSQDPFHAAIWCGIDLFENLQLVSSVKDTALSKHQAVLLQANAWLGLALVGAKADQPLDRILL